MWLMRNLVASWLALGHPKSKPCQSKYIKLQEVPSFSSAFHRCVTFGKSSFLLLEKKEARLHALGFSLPTLTATILIFLPLKSRSYETGVANINGYRVQSGKWNLPGEDRSKMETACPRQLYSWEHPFISVFSFSKRPQKFLIEIWSNL